MNLSLHEVDDAIISTGSRRAYPILAPEWADSKRKNRIAARGARR